MVPSAIIAAAGSIAQFKAGEPPVQYLLVDSESQDAVVTFDSLLEMDYATDGTVVSNPVEEGSFATYNKTFGPRSIKARLAIMGANDKLTDAIQLLNGYVEDTALVDFITPIDYFPDYTLENFSYTLKSDGMGLLVADIVLTEVRQVEAKYTDAKPITQGNAKKAGNASSQKGGKTQAKEPNKSAAKVLKDKASSLWG